MKPQAKFYIRIFLPLLLLIVVANSCEKDKDQSNYKYLESYELLKSYTPEQVQTILIIGSIIYPEIDTLISTSAYGVDVYSVKYKTTFKDSSIFASGIVSVPKEAGNFPIVSFQNGTNTCNSNAPSENSGDQFLQLISIAAGNGYIVTIPDYIGFGESSQILHPYHHRESSDRAIIDLIEASEELISTKEVIASSNGNLFLMGYSQGGWATFSVLDNLEKNPIEGLTPVATSLGAGAYNIYKMGKYIVSLDEYPNPFYLPYFIQSRRANGFMSGELSTYFKEPYASTIPGLFNGTICNTEMNAELPTKMSDLLTSDLISNFETASQFEPLRQELTNNSITPWNVKTPLLIYHSKGDKSVPYFESEDLYNGLLQAGVNSSNIKYFLIDNPDLDHGDAIIPWGIQTLAWFGSLK
jgi:pimeloyl-ACP methyl ester carboxylesterase